MENNTIEKRQAKENELLIEQLKRTPIVQVSCEKVGIGRATYYRRRKEDPDFALKTDEALAEGIKLMNDMAESKLLSAINEGNLTGIIFWLKNRHEAYKTKVEISSGQREEVVITEEQEQIIKNAMGLIQAEKKEEKNE